MSDNVKLLKLEKNSKLTIFREKRIEIPDNIESKAQIKIDDKTVSGRIKNLSEFGARLLLPTHSLLLRANTTISHITLELDGHKIFEGSCKIVDDKNFGKMLSVGIFLKSNFINLENVKSILTTNDKKDYFLKQSKALDLAEHIEADFKVLCADLIHLFTTIKESLNHEHTIIKAMAKNDSFYNSMIDHTTDLAMALYADKIRGFFEKFQAVVNNFNPQEHALHKSYFRSIFHPILLGAPFVRRAYEKPLGYAGDYGLMLMFYEYGNIGNDLFDKFIHKYACNEPSAVANQNRVKFLSTLLTKNLIAKESSKDRIKITSVACGPAMEIRLTLENLVNYSTDKSLDIILLDQEAEALDYSQKKIKSVTHGSENVSCVPIQEDAVLGIIKKSNFTKILDDSEAIVCAGLFDYLSDRVSKKMIERLYEKLAPGGTLLIGNVSDTSPDRFSMNYLMEWNLFLRSPEDLKNLVPESIKKAESRFEVIQEPLGINLFLSITKNGNAD